MSVAMLTAAVNEITFPQACHMFHTKPVRYGMFQLGQLPLNVTSQFGNI
jgi:hypothetical protein